MNKWLLMTAILIGIISGGCSNNGMTGEKPPDVILKANDKAYETTLGSYCWTGWREGVCVDTVGPVEILEDENPVQVKPGEKVILEMDYELKPNESHVTQINGNKETDILLENNHFLAPMEKGIYYYAYSVNWMDEKETDVSKGDAFYVFSLEVK
ncbi:hypothetical protein [Metabacillus fastidiosus]|uniref:hypothetical protein n=1 Tax=Metabacillus fastidiosus TaxID=1458 RepID=UPI002E204327|nr:hypothetical protein [Metabacillus fastidiosus]